MGSLSIWHWLIVVLVVSPVVPIAVMLRRVGLSPWLAILFVVPLAGWVAIWVVAYARWPKVDPPRA